MHPTFHRRVSPWNVGAAIAFAALHTLSVRCKAQEATSETPKVSVKNVRAADDAYLAGSRLLADNHAAAAEASFARALQLDPTRNEYALALAVAKEHHVTALVQSAAKARLAGNAAEAERLFAEAHALDPDNLVVTQHLSVNPILDVPSAPVVSNEISRLAGAIHFTPSAALQNFHRRGSAQTLLQEVFGAYGIKVTFDPTVSGPPDLRLDLENVDYDTATRILLKMTHVFAVPLQEKSALLAKDTLENRDRFEPKIEETIYLPGLTTDQLTELSNVAKNIFDLKQVIVSPGAGEIVVRGSEDAVNLVNATYADLVDGGAEVLLDVHFYEVDKTHMRNLGVNLPSSVGAFSIAGEAQQLVSANQSAINQAVSAGLLTLNGSPIQNLLKEVEFLFAAGLINTSQFTNFIGTLGGGLSFAGVFLGSGATLNALLNSSDARALDDIQVRVGDRQTANLRSGTRYPITTATYSSGVSSSLASSLAGVKVNGVNVSSLLGSLTSSATVPQVQFEDLGLTLKVTPQVLKSGQVFVHLDMKIEALGGGTLNTIPILNSRQLTSDITIAEGQTALLSSETNSSESRSIAGLPFLGEIPGFQGTDRITEKDSGDLLVTLTPRIVRRRSPLTTSRRLLANLNPEPQ